jgi:hypothetical protein
VGEDRGDSIARRAVVLPTLAQHPSPNVSDRRGIVPYLIVVHRPAGNYAGSLATLLDDSRPIRERVSAHVLTDSNRRAAQLVPWHRKAWTAAAFNSASYNVEVDDDAWNGRDPAAFATAARIVAYLCKRTGIPPVWSRSPLDAPGVIRHLDLGLAGGGHRDPTTDVVLWRQFIAACMAEHRRGGFRPTWGVGELHRIDT